MITLLNSQFKAIKNSFLQNQRFLISIKNICAKLDAYQIRDFCYVRFENNHRIVQLSTADKYIEHYIKTIDKYPKEDFFENFIAKLKIATRSWHVYPYDYPINIEKNKIFHNEQAFNMVTSAILTLSDEKLGILERFGFFPREDNIHFSNTILTRMQELEHFCYYFKEKAAPIIKKITEINLITTNKNVDQTVNIEPLSENLALRRYYLQGLKPNTYLTRQEFACLRYAINGICIKMIANHLGCSSRTVEKHLENIRHKSLLSNLAQLHALNSTALFR